MTKEIIEEKWQNIFLNTGTEKGLGDLSMMISTVSDIIQSKKASAVEAERAKWVFASEDVRKTMTERFLQDKQNEQINPSKE